MNKVHVYSKVCCLLQTQLELKARRTGQTSGAFLALPTVATRYSGNTLQQLSAVCQSTALCVRLPRVRLTPVIVALNPVASMHLMHLFSLLPVQDRSPLLRGQGACASGGHLASFAAWTCNLVQGTPPLLSGFLLDFTSLCC